MTTFSKSKKRPAQSGEPEQIEMRYIPVGEVVLTGMNPKKHDLGGICESIVRYGFRNPPIWDETLNNGRGGVAAGNGRTEALAAMEKQNLPVPRGIAIDDQGRWCMPVIFGCNATNQAEAISFLIDDNNLNLGGDFTHWDMLGMWEPEPYKATLVELAELNITPITVDSDAIASLLSGIRPQKEDDEDPDLDGKGPGGAKVIKCPNCDHEWEAGGGRR